MEEMLIVITDESGKAPSLVNEKCDLCGRRKQLSLKRGEVACVCCDKHRHNCRHSGRARSFLEQKQRNEIPI